LQAASTKLQITRTTARSRIGSRIAAIFPLTAFSQTEAHNQGGVLL
jgi:hypothetical protein